MKLFTSTLELRDLHIGASSVTCVLTKKLDKSSQLRKRNSDRLGNEKMEVIPVVVKDLKNV